MAKREWKLSVGIDTVLEKDSLKKAEKKLEELEKPIEVKVDTKSAEKKMDRLLSQRQEFEKEAKRLEKELSKNVESGDTKAIKATVKAQEEVEDQLKRVRKEQQGLNSDLRAYKEQMKAARGESRKLSEEEKKVDKLIEKSKTPRPKKPKASDSGDVAAAKEETEANEKLVESIENVGKAQRKNRTSKPKKAETAEIKEEIKANEELAEAVVKADEVKKRSRNVKPKVSATDEAKEEAQANEELAGSIDTVIKAKKKAKVTTPRVDEVGTIKNQVKANEGLAKSYDKVAGAIERTAEEQKKLDELNRKASNQKDWLKYLDGALDKSKFETSGKRDATEKLRSATNYLVTQRKESYQNAHGEYAKEMAEVMWMHAYQEAERQGVAQSVLAKYDTDAKSNYEINLKILQEARDFRLKLLEDTQKQIEANEALASSYKKVGEAAKAAGEKEKKSTKNKNVAEQSGAISSYEELIETLKEYNNLKKQIVGFTDSEDEDVDVVLKESLSKLKNKLLQNVQPNMKAYLTSLLDMQPVNQDYLDTIANTFAMSFNKAIHKATEKVQKPQLLQDIETLESKLEMDEIPLHYMWGRKTAAKSNLEMQWELYQKMKKEYDDPEHATDLYGTDYDSLLRQQSILEVCIALYEKYGGKVEELGKGFKGLKEFSDMQGFTGAYQYAVDEYNENLTETERKVSANKELAESYEQVEQAAKAAGEAEKKEKTPKEVTIQKLSALDEKAKATDDHVELFKIVKAREDIVNLAESESMFNEQELVNQRAINDELKKKLDLLRIATNIVYHAGDLSNPSDTMKSLPLGNVSPSRGGSNVFNGFTGLYTTEDVDGFVGNEWGGAPLSAIDLSYYKLFDAKNDELAKKAQIFFDDLNSTIYGYYRFFDHGFDELQVSTDVKTVEDLYDDFKSVFKGVDLDFDAFNDFVTKSRAIVEGHKFEDIDVPAISDGVAKSHSGTVLQGVSKEVFNSDSFKTQLLRMLGFEGIDLRGTKFNSTYAGGTVIFDVKPESIKTVNEKWSDVMAQHGYEVSEDDLKVEEKRRQLAFETAEVYSRQAESQKEINAEMREAVNLGYHAGDLGKAETYGNFAYGARGTGHFGTGTYFVGNEKAIEGYNSRNGVPAPVERVDFSKYNLFKPSDTEEAYDLHRALKMINDDLIDLHRFDDLDLDFLVQSYENGDKSPVLNFLNNYLNDSARSHYEDEALGHKAYLESLDESKIREEAHRGYTSIMSDLLDADELSDELLIMDELIENSVQERLQETKQALENFDIDQEIAKRIVYDIEHGNFESISDMQTFKDTVVDRLSKIFVGKTKEELANALEETFKTISQYSESEYYKVDNASAVFMKQLGYEGIDVRHTELDNTAYGSVIYDLKGEDLARRQEILNERAVETKSIGQSVLELEKLTGKSLMKVIEDYDSLDNGIKEKVNSILKSIGLMNDQLEFTFKRSQGGNAKAVLGQDFVVLQKALEADEGYAENLINKLKEAQKLGLNVTPILERVFSESSTGSGGFRPGYEIQQRAAGSNVHETQKSLININSALQENQTLLGASENQLQKFIADYIKLDEIGVQIDPSKASNFLYDAEKGFSFIDLGLKNANDKAKALKQIFKEITVVLANTSTFNALGQDESLGFSSGQIVAKVADSFEALGIATREEIDSWAKEFYDGFGNIFDGYTGKTSSAIQWIDELRTKIEEIPQLLSASQLTKAFDAVDLGAYFKSLNITDESVIQKLKDLYTQFLQLSAAMDNGFDVEDKFNATFDEIVDTIMQFGSVTHDAHNIYEEFYEYMKGKKISYNTSQKAEFGDDWKATKQRFNKYLTPLSSGKGIGVDQIWSELEAFGLFSQEDAHDEASQLQAVLRHLGNAIDARRNGGKIYSSITDSDVIIEDVSNQWGKMMHASAQSIEAEETALKDLEGQAEKTAKAKKKVTKANKELGDAAVDSKGKIEGETEAAEDLEEKANNVWSTPRQGGSLEGLNIPTEFVGENGQDIVQMFAKVKNEIEELTGNPVKIDFVSKPNAEGELEAVGATLEYINKESGVTVKQFYEVARGEDDVVKATQTAEKATLKATKAQKDFNAQLKQQLAYQQLDTFRKEMGQFTVDLTAAQNAANKIVDKDSLDEFNVQLKIARESLKGMKAQMKSQNTLDPIVAAEKRLKSLDSELESLKNKFIFKAGSGVDTKWIDDQIASIKKLRDAFNNEKDPNKKTGFYKQITSEIDKAENGMTNLNELIRLQNKLFKDRRTLSKMDSSTESYKILEQSVVLQGKELSNLIRNSQHKETIMKRAVQFENELAAATQDRINKQEQAFNKRYSGVDVIQSGSWDKNAFADYQDAMRDFANGVLDGDVRVNGFNKSGTEMYVVLSDAEGALHKITVALDKSSGKMIAFTTGTNGITDALKELGKSGLQQVTRVAGMYLGVNDFIRYFSQGIQHVRDIDASMTELRKVTDETEASYAKFLETASDAAGKIGSTVKDFTTVTSDFARLGYSIEEASEMAKTALIYENVGDGFSSVEEASESIISTMKAFGIEAEDTMGIVDRFNEVGNNFAIDSKGIGDALQRSASALVEGGNSIDEAIALVTAANSVIQNPEQVGTALKTLSLRLRSTKIELEDMGEDAEGAATSTAKLREQLLGLTGGKVDIMLNENTFKNTTQILREMAAVWSEMDDISRAGALELIGGKRQANILSSLITNFETVEDVIKTSANSAGSALAENQKYIESIQGHVDVFNNSLQTFWNNFIDSGMIKGVVDLGTLIFDFFNNIGAGLTTVIGILGGASITTLFKGFDKWFKDTTGNVKLVDSLTSSFGKLKGGISSVIKTLGGFVVAHPILLAISAALAVATAAIIGVKNAQEEAALEAVEHAKEIKEENEAIEEYKKQASELRNELDSGNLSEQEAYDVRKQLIGIQDELISRFGKEAEGINLVTGAIEDQIDAIDKLAVKNAQEWLNENSKKDTVLGFIPTKSAIEQAIDAIETEYDTYDVYGTSVWNKVFRDAYGDDWSKYSEDAAQEYQDFIESLGGTLNLKSNAIGFEDITRGQLDDYYTQIENWLREYGAKSDKSLNFNDLIGKIERDKQERLGENYQTHKANYDAYLENTAIASYTEAYGKILDAEDEFLKASTDEGKLARIKEYKEYVESAMAEANGDASMQKYFAGMLNKFEQEEFKLKVSLDEENLKTELQKIISEGGEKGLSALDDTAIKDMVNRGLNVEGAIDVSGQYTNEQIAGLIQLQSEADAAGVSINNLISTLVDFGLIAGRPVEAVELVEAAGQAYSTLVTEAEKYASINTVLNEITYDNIEISEEQYELLKELVGSEKEFSEAIDTTNGYIVKNSSVLKDLVKQKQKEQAVDVKRAKAQSRLRYYDLYKQMRSLTKGQNQLTDAELDNVNALYEQMNAVEKTIYQYNLLELQLLGATDAFTAFEDAQKADSETDYIGSAEEMVLALGEAFKTAELGSETAQAAIAGLVPESLYKDLDTVDEKMSAIYDYFKNGKLSEYFTIKFDDDGAIESAEMKLVNMRKFIEDGLNDSGANVFDGSDWQHFEFSDEFLSELDKLPQGADKLQYFADKMNVTKEVAFAFIDSVKDHDIEWLNGDYGSLFDPLMPDSLSRDITDNISALSDLEHKLANGKISVEDYNNEMYGLDGQLKLGKITQEQYNSSLDDLNQKLADNEITIDEYNKSLQGLSGYTDILAENAREEAASWYVKKDALTYYRQHLDDLYAQLEAGVDDDGNIIDADKIKQEIDIASRNINRLTTELSTIEEPDDIVLQFAMDEVDKDLAEITNKIGAVVEGTHYKFDVEAGEYQVILDTTDPNYQEIMNYVTLLNEKHSLELEMGEETPTVIDQLSNIAGILEKITDILEKTYNIDVETDDAMSNTNTFLDVWKSISSKSVTLSVLSKGISGLIDSIFVNGTAHSSGTAHATGNWGLPKAEHNSLVGELGQELVVDPHSGRYYTVGDNGAEFVDLPKDAIVFNHKQTESLLSNGYVTSRGKALAEGNAHVTLFSDGASQDELTGSSVKDKVEDAVDFIEIKLEEIESSISKTTAEIANFIDDASKLNKKNAKYDALVNKEKEKEQTYRDAEKYYDDRAADILKKIPKKYQEWAKNGAIAIEDFVGENEKELADLINEYREWDTKADEAELGWLESIAQQAAYRIEQLEDIASDYDNLVNYVGSKSDIVEAEMSLMEEFGAIQSPDNYQSLIDNSLEQIGFLQDKKADLEATLADAVSNKDIIVGTDEWYEAKSMISDVDLEIVQCREDIVSWSNAMEDLRWDALDRLMTRLEAIDSQLSHLFDRFTDGDNVVDDDGNWTNQGIAALGTAFQQRELAQTKANKLGEEIKQLQEDFAEGLYAGREEVYYEQLENLTEQQWEAIEAYEAAGDAIVDLNKTRIDAIKKGIDKEIDAYKELIEAKKEALDADKDSRDFERSVQDKQKEIDRIDRKIVALRGDNSASAKAQRKQLEEERAELQTDLEDLYYDRSVENQKNALDDSGEAFEKAKTEEKESLDKYLEDEEKVISDSMNTVKSNTGIVLSEIQGIAAQYGVSISTEITKPWAAGETAIAGFSTKFTEFSNTFSVSTFTTELQKIVTKYEDIESAAKNAAAAMFASVGGNPDKISSDDTNSSDKAPEVKPPQEEPANEPQYKDYTVEKGDTLWGIAKQQGSGLSWQDIYAANKDTIKDPDKIYVGQTIKIPKYAKGTTGIKDDQFAWIDEIGEELVLHADGSGKLAYLTKGSSVIPSDLTQKLLDLAVDPTQTLENSRPIISAPQITNNEININMEFGEVVHIDTVTNDTIPDLTKAIEKQMDKYMKGLNNQIRKYSR